MGTQGENIDVLEIMDSVSDQEFPLLFINKLVSTFEHSKEEIVDLVKTKRLPDLKQLRELNFSELVAKLPEYAGCKMYACLKSDLLAEAVYVFGFSPINALRDRHLSKCLKPTLDLNSTSVSEHEEDISKNDAHDIQSLTEMCILLRDEVKTLLNTVKTHVNCFSILETLFTAAQIQLADSKKNKEHLIRSRDQAEGEVTEQPAGADLGTREPAS